jgi:hypothetical protein
MGRTLAEQRGEAVQKRASIPLKILILHRYFSKF